MFYCLGTASVIVLGYSPDVIAQVREAIDLVKLVEESVPLKRKGANYFGNCPYHAEKTASFSVHAQRQMYYCFGCHESGDAFSWYMRQNGASFPEAIEALAQRAGIPVETYQQRGPSGQPR